MPSVLLDLDAPIARITLNRPERLNSFSQTMRGELLDALAAVRQRQARVLILTGAGRAFCAGQDLNERIREENAAPPDLGESIDTFYKPLILGLRELPCPVIAAVNGTAAGAGASLALACDLVIAARSARFIQSFSRVGLGADSGGSYFLPRLVGTARAMGLLLGADPLGAEQAAEWGLIWKCVDDDQLAAETEALAARLASGPPLAYAAIKQALQASSANSLDSQLELERHLQQKLGISEDYQEGVQAFVDKRAPRFTGK